MCFFFPLGSCGEAGDPKSPLRLQSNASKTVIRNMDTRYRCTLAVEEHRVSTASVEKQYERFQDVHHPYLPAEAKDHVGRVFLLGPLATQGKRVQPASM